MCEMNLNTDIFILRQTEEYQKGNKRRQRQDGGIRGSVAKITPDNFSVIGHCQRTGAAGIKHDAGT